MGGKKVVLPLLALAAVLSIVVAGKMSAGGLSRTSDVEPMVKGVETPTDMAKAEDAIGQKVNLAENSPLGRAEDTRTISDVLRAHVLPGVSMVYRVVRYDEKALKEDILNTFPDVEDVRVDEDIVYIKYKDGTVVIYETGFENEGGS